MSILQYVTREMLCEVCLRFGWKPSDERDRLGSPFVTDEGETVYIITAWLGRDMDLIALIGKAFDANGMDLSIRFGKHANIVYLFDRSDPDNIISVRTVARDRTTYAVCDLFIKLVDIPKPEEGRMIQVTKCSECPCRHRMAITIRVNGENARYTCTNSGGRIIEDVETIPDWCPLEKCKA